MRINRDVVSHLVVFLAAGAAVVVIVFASKATVSRIFADDQVADVAESADFQADALERHIEILRQNGTTIDEALLDGKSLAERQDVVADAIRWAREMQRLDEPQSAGGIEPESEEDSGPTFVILDDFTFPGEDLAEPEGETPASDLSFTIGDELLLTTGPADIFIGVDPDTLEPLMSYDASENRWTLSDRFLTDVADALVPVLEERGFVPVSDPPLFYRLFDEWLSEDTDKVGKWWIGNVETGHIHLIGAQDAEPVLDYLETEPDLVVPDWRVSETVGDLEIKGPLSVDGAEQVPDLWAEPEEAAP